MHMQSPCPNRKVLARIFNDCKEGTPLTRLQRRWRIARLLAQRLGAIDPRACLRVTGSLASSTNVDERSDIDFQVISDRYSHPFGGPVGYGSMVPARILLQFQQGLIDVIAVKATLQGVSISVQFLSRHAIRKAFCWAGTQLRIYRTTPTETRATLYGFRDEIPINLHLVPYGLGHLLMVPNLFPPGGEFRINLYQHMLLSGISLRDTPEFASLQRLLFREGRTWSRAHYSLSQSECLRIFGSRVNRWSESFRNKMVSRFA